MTGEDIRPENEKSDRAEGPESAADVLSVTQHAVTIGGQPIPYTVTCGTIVLKEEAKKKKKSAGRFLLLLGFFLQHDRATSDRVWDGLPADGNGMLSH